MKPQRAKAKRVGEACCLCHKPSNPLYMCDQDAFDNKYCGECFEKVGCHAKHEEGCATMVLSDGKDCVAPPPKPFVTVRYGKLTPAQKKRNYEYAQKVARGGHLMRREKRSVTNFIEALAILARYMDEGVDTQYFIGPAHDQIWITTNNGNPGVLTKDGQRLDELGFFYDESVGSWSQYT